MYVLNHLFQWIVETQTHLPTVQLPHQLGLSLDTLPFMHAMMTLYSALVRSEHVCIQEFGVALPLPVTLSVSAMTHKMQETLFSVGYSTTNNISYKSYFPT